MSAIATESLRFCPPDRLLPSESAFAERPTDFRLSSTTFVRASGPDAAWIGPGRTWGTKIQTRGHTHSPRSLCVTRIIRTVVCGGSRGKHISDELQVFATCQEVPDHILLRIGTISIGRYLGRVPFASRRENGHLWTNSDVRTDLVQLISDGET